MASYQADIQIGVKGKQGLNSLEKQLTRVQSQVNKLNKSLTLKSRAQRIQLDTRAATNAIKKLETRINKLGRTITVRLRTIEDSQKARQGNSSTVIATGNNSPVGVALATSRRRLETQKQITSAVKDETAANRANLQIQKQIEKVDDEILKGQQELTRLNKQLPEQGGRSNYRQLLETGIATKKAQAEAAKLIQRVDAQGLGPADAGKEFKKFYDNLPERAKRSLGQVDDAVRNSVQQQKSALQGLETRRQQLVDRGVRAEIAGENRITENTKTELRERQQAFDAYWQRRQRQVARVQARDRLRATKARGQALKNAAGVGLGAAATQIPGLGGVATGALGGAAVGGKAGALVGGLVGGITDATRALVGFSVESGKFFNKLQLSRKALANTVSTTEEYKQALAGIRGIATDFGGGIDNITSSYTKLNAAARSSGFTVEEVTETYRGLAAANTALGGNSERLQGILLATQQVFSKGKVQAEELRGQIGERLAGAFSKFAKSAGLSTSQLDKALEKGEVSLKDFQRFAKSLLEEYEEDAKKLYQEPENAAQRLDDAMKDLKAAMGPIVQDLMVMFINLANTIVTQLTRALNAINNARLQGQKAVVAARKEDLRDRALSIQEAREELEPNSKDGRVTIPNFTAGAGLDAAVNSYKEARKAFEREGRKLTRLEKQLGEIDVSGSDIDNPNNNTETNKDTNKGGGSASKLRESQLPALQRELALKSRIDELDQKIIEANKVKDSDLVTRLQGEQRLAEIAKSRLDILAEEIPMDEKKAKLALNELDAKEAMRDTDEELRQAAEARQQSIDDSIRGFQNEIELAGVRNEAAKELLKIEQDIREMRQPGQNFTEQQIQAYRAAAQGAAAAREEQRQYNEVLSQVQGPVSALTTGLRDVVAGTKSAEEAFADFLNTIANQLIQTASIMIAQYIAIGLAKAFAGMGGNTSASSTVSAINGVQNTSNLGTIWNGMAIGASGGFVNTSKSGGVDGKGGRAMIVHPDEFIVPASGNMPGIGGDTMVNIVVNTNGSVTTDSTGEKAKEAQALGRMVEASVVSIINREKRPGGLLTR